VGAAAAVMPYMSQNIGAGSIDRARKAMSRGIWITVLLGGGLGALSAVFSGPLSAIMSADPKVIAFSQQKMIVVSSCYFLSGINEIMCAALRSLKKPIIPTAATLVYMCGIRFVWVYAIFPFIPNNLTFLYLIWPIGWILSIIQLVCILIPTAKKLRQKHMWAEQTS
jgi:Na+-driven multidrug efflux pump